MVFSETIKQRKQFLTRQLGSQFLFSYMSFWIDPKNAPARICIGIFANLSVNQSSVADKNLPRVSYVKALDIWLFALGFKMHIFKINKPGFPARDFYKIHLSIFIFRDFIS